MPDAFALRNVRVARLDADGQPGEWFDVAGASLDDAGASPEDLVETIDAMAGGSIEFTLDPETVPDLLAVFFCHLEHPHPERLCVPWWIPLGEN